jgi:hypothetical protein
MFLPGPAAASAILGLSPKGYRPETVLKMERLILEVLDYSLDPPPLATVLHARYQNIIEHEIDVRQSALSR